ncbi:MAG: Gfo/Idh/MocA family oxidoreductase [Firmicutes bacterium]|nr:Gfo/Idh/MocA family oxidoreductase [Bacillota bacterium]
MKKIGFIDYFLNEWHADNYPAWIRERSGDTYEVAYAYALSEPPFEGKLSNRQWADKNGIELLSSIEELVEKSDAIVVLSPDHPQFHKELSRIPLMSGKRVYIDKTFATSGQEAKEIFAVAENYQTPCYSSSALRFSKKLQKVKDAPVQGIISTAGGPVDSYLIHQLEPIVTLMGPAIDRVLYTGNPMMPAWEIHFMDDRTASMALFKGEAPFRLQIGCAEQSDEVLIDDDFFLFFIDAMLEFFDTGIIPVPHEETIAIMAALESCWKSMKTPGEWLSVHL